MCGTCLLATRVNAAYWRVNVVGSNSSRPWFPDSSMEVTVKDSPGEMEATAKDSPDQMKAAGKHSPEEMEATAKDSPDQMKAAGKHVHSREEMEATGKDSPGEANVKDSSVEVTVKINATESSDSYTVDYLFEHLALPSQIITSENHKITL